MPWFVLNFIPLSQSKKETSEAIVARYNAAEQADLEIFAPSILLMEVEGNKIVEKQKPLTYHYVFVRGELETVKNLCSQSNGFSFLLNHSSEERYATVSEADMYAFRIIARTHQNRLPFYDISHIDLQEGDRIEILGGDLNGLKGTLMPVAKSKNSNIVIAASSELGAIVWNVKPSHVRILEFAKNCKRPYDLIEAFTPKIYEALRTFHSGVALSEKEIASLSVFCRRMEATKLDNHKLDAKLSAMLLAAFTILGDRAAAEKASARFQKYQHTVTNPWTRALITLLLSISSGTTAPLPSVLSTLPQSSSTSKAQNLLLAEYRHYLQP